MRKEVFEEVITECVITESKAEQIGDKELKRAARHLASALRSFEEITSIRLGKL